MRRLTQGAVLAVALWLAGCGGGTGSTATNDGGTSGLVPDQSAFSRMDSSTTTSSTDGALTGITTDAGGNPVGSCTVTVTGSSAGRATTASFSTLSGPSGQFEIGNMQPGQYHVGAAHESFGVAESEVHIKAGQLADLGHQQLQAGGGFGGQQGQGSFNQAGAPLADAGSIVGKVTAPNGDPVADARLRIGERLHACTGELGAFAFPPLPEGTYAVECRAEGFATARQDASVVPGEATQLVFQLEVGDSDSDPVAGTGTVTGTVTDADTGDPLAGAAVELRTGRAEQTTAADGTFTFTDVPAGGGWLRVNAEGYLPLRIPLRLPDGASIDVPIELVTKPDPTTQATGTILVTVLDDTTGDPIDGAQVSIDGRGRIAADETGQVEVTDVPVGRHMAIAGARGYQPKRERLEVVENETAAVELRLTVDDGEWQGPPESEPGAEAPRPGGPRPGEQQPGVN